MKKFASLTKTQQQYIKAEYLNMSGSELAKRCRASKTLIYRFLKEHNLSVPLDVKRKFRSAGMIGRTSFTTAEDRFIRDNYLKYPIKRLGEKMGRSYTGIMHRLKVLGLQIPEDIKSRNVAAGRIKKGDVPPNKGKKMPAAVYEKAKRTMFKPGQLPPNTLTDGAVTVRKDNRGVEYRWIRISLAKWVPLHRHVWETHNGPIPRKLKLAFKDGDTLNCDIGNLELLTSAQLMLRNTVHNYPKPIAQAVQLRGALNRQINKHLKKLQNEEQNQ